MRKGLTQISQAGNPKRKRPNCHRSKTPRSRGVGTPSWAGPLTTSPRGLWVSGYLPRAMADSAQRAAIRKPTKLRAHQISVGGSFGGFLHAELSANGSIMLLVIWIAIDWFLSSTLRLHSRITPTRPLTLTMFYIWLSFVGEFTFADGESDGLLVLTCTVAVRTQVARVRHRATRDVRRTTEEQALREGGALRIEDTLSQALRWGEGRVSLCS